MLKSLLGSGPARKGRSGIGLLVSSFLALTLVVAANGQPATAADATGCSALATSFADGTAGTGTYLRMGCAGDAGSLRSLASSDNDLVATIDINPGSPLSAGQQQMMGEVVATAHADQAKGLSLSGSFDLHAQRSSPGYYTTLDRDVDYDGSIQIVGNSVVIVVPLADIGASGFWDSLGKKILTGLVVTATAIVTGGVCLAFFNVGAVAAAPVCGAVSGALSSGVGELLSAALDGKPIDGDAWGAALGSAIWGAIAGAFGGALVDMFTANSIGLISNMQTIFKNAATRFGSWVNPLKLVSGTLNDAVAGRLLATLQALQRRGVGGQIVAVPSYINPAGDPTAWNNLIGASTDKVGIAVANVLNGPGSAVVPAWTNAINRTHGSGKQVLGYVDTGYLGQTGMTTRLGSTTTADWIAQAEQDINAWYSLYGDSVDGIFFDDGFNACGGGNVFPAIYEELNRYEKIHHPGALTVLNPGTVVPQCYENSADVLLTFEGDINSYLGTNANPDLDYKAPDWTPAEPQKFWHIVFGVGAGQVASVDDLSRTRNAGYVYITDDVLSNPYDTLPSYWSAEQSQVPGGIPTAAEAAAQPAGPLPHAPTGLAVTAFDYTSATITWTAGSSAYRHLVYLDGSVVASLPPTMTRVTIGNLAPGGHTYALKVTAQGAADVETAPTATVSVTTLSLPGGKNIANYGVRNATGAKVYAADFLTPYSFRRVYLSPPRGSTESCWYMSANAVDQIGGPFCAHWLIENATLLIYSGTTVGEWSWTPVAYVPPTINGYTYSWNVSTAGIGDASGFAAFEGEGYGPFVDVYTPGCVPTVTSCPNLPTTGTPTTRPTPTS